METSNKQKIKEALVKYCDRYESQNEAANSMNGVSAATVSQIINNNWDLISDKMWRTVAAGIGMTKQKWVVADTSVHKKLKNFFWDAQNNPQGIRAIVVNASMGKSIAVNEWAASSKSSYYIRCHRHMTVRMMFRDMLQAMGKDSSGTISEMIDNVVTYLERKDKPLFIIDEADKVKDEVLEMFIDLENKLHAKCGFVFLSTPYLKKRIESGVARGKRGFAELYSRMKKFFWDLTPDKITFRKDVALICTANGIAEESIIMEFTNKCDFDFRVLFDLITAHKNK